MSVESVSQIKKHSSLKENKLQCFHAASLTLMTCTREYHHLTFCVCSYEEGRRFPAIVCFHTVGLSFLFFVFGRLLILLNAEQTQLPLQVRTTESSQCFTRRAQLLRSQSESHNLVTNFSREKKKGKTKITTCCTVCCVYLHTLWDSFSY